MALTTEEKKAVLGEYGLHETDTGSPEAQVAMLTKRITDLIKHLTCTANGGFAGGRRPESARLALKQGRSVQGLNFLQQFAGGGLAKVQARCSLVNVLCFAQCVKQFKSKRRR